MTDAASAGFAATLRAIPCGLLFVILLAASVRAETFSVSLGATSLGQLIYADAGDKSTIHSILGNTPLGVFNGSFTAISTGSTASSQFTAESRSSRKQRFVTVEIHNNQATRTSVAPAEELTGFSDVTRVPAGVMDPVRTMGQLLHAKGCPAPLQMYDGRRVVAMRSDRGTLADVTLTCTLQYKVIAGPGHLSPLGISSAKIELSYDTAGGSQRLHQMRIKSGIFSLRVDLID